MGDSGESRVWRTRLDTVEDLPFLREMLYEASHCRSTAPRTTQVVDAALQNPRLAMYVDGWGRPGDVAMIAEDPASWPVGAA